MIGVCNGMFPAGGVGGAGYAMVILRKTMELVHSAAKSRICVHFKLEVEGGGVCPPPPS